MDGTFGISLVLEQPVSTNSEGERQAPQLKLRLANDNSGLASQVFTFEEGYYFDQPSATRTLIGFIRSINEYSKNEAGSVYMSFNTESSNFNLLYNCKDEDL